ncbi:MAG: SurA N-terminal domain-containing protein [bacterium]|nr:SurA N-terminal domain-containing protein [bacterium]
MKRHHFYIGLIALVTFGAGVFYVLHNALYPVATVNGAMISAREFQRVALAGLNFYVRSQEAAAHRQLTSEEVSALYGEIRRATLDKLVAERLIDAELERRLGDRVLALANRKIADAQVDRLREAVPELYGTTFEEFQEMLLLPEAKQVLLDEALKGELADIQSWLLSARRDASARIFLSKLQWSNGTVEIAP